MATVNKKISVKEYIKIYAMLILAGTLMALGIYVFVLPSSIVAGGIGGLSNILYYTFNIPVSIGSIALNAPLLIAALFKLKKSYSVRTVFACVVYSLVTMLFEKINFFQFTDSRIIGVVMGGALSGAGITVAYFAGGSNGGSEIVTGLVSVKNPNVEMGKVLLVFNLGVYALAFVLQRELMQVLYSLLMSYVTSFCVKIFMNGIDPVLKYTVITRKAEELDAELSRVFKRGATNIDVVDENGAPTGQKTVIVVIQYRQNQAFKRILRKVDGECFAFCTSINAVLNKPDFNKRYK